jgi:hypothetical protein
MSATWFPGITPSREVPAEIEWRAETEPAPRPAPAEASAFAAVARKN